MKIDVRLPLVLLVLLGSAVPACSEDRLFPLAFLTDRDGNYEIYLVSAEDEPPVNVTYHPASDYGFSWSPDGGRLVFGTDRDGNREIYVCDADGGGQVNLTQHSSGDRQPCWSPDGDSIVFVSDRDHPQGEIYVMEADGTNVRRLTDNENYEELPCWSPDGRLLAFSRSVPDPDDPSADANGEVFVMDVDGASPRRLTDKAGFDSSPAWSPDGRRIAFHGAGDATFDIFVIASDGTGLVNLTNDEAEDWQPHWSSDGSSILYCSGQDAADYGLWVMGADGSGRRRLMESGGQHPRRRPMP